MSYKNGMIFALVSVMAVMGCSKSPADRIAELLPQWDSSMSEEEVASEVNDVRKMPVEKQEVLSCQLELMVLLKDIGIGSMEEIKTEAQKKIAGKSLNECKEVVARVENEFKELLAEARKTYSGSPADYIASMLPKLDPTMSKDKIDAEVKSIKEMAADQQEALVYRMKLMLLLNEVGWGTMRMIKREADDRMKGKNASECKAALARARFELREVIDQLRKEKPVKRGNGGGSSQKSSESKNAAMRTVAKGMQIPTGEETSDTKQMAEAAALKGRNLFVLITQTNTEREGAGMSSVWPKTGNALSGDADDIAGVAFDSANAYFEVLFDSKRMNTSEWMPYVKGSDCLNIFKDDNVCGWIVIVNADDDSPDTLPVLVSSNVNPDYLSRRSKGVIPIGTKAGRAKTVWGDEYVVVVRKNGKTDIISAESVTTELIYGDDSPQSFVYLDVKGANRKSRVVPQTSEVLRSSNSGASERKISTSEEACDVFSRYVKSRCISWTLGDQVRARFYELSEDEKIQVARKLQELMND